MSTDNTSLLRLPDVVRKTGLAKATIYQKIADKSFPSPIKLSERASAWVSTEVEQWVQQRIAASRNKAA